MTSLGASILKPSEAGRFIKCHVLTLGMWNEPDDDTLRRLPRLYATEAVPWQDKVIHQHYFLGGSDWYMAEYSPERRFFFGYAILNNDLQCAEWGYISFDELRSIRVSGIEVDRDVHWRPRKASEVEKIVAGHGGLGG